MQGAAVAEAEDSTDVVQSVFTVVAPVDADAVGALQAVLERIATDPADNSILPFGRLPGLHYASLVLFPAREGRQPLLVLESNVDGSIEEHLGQLVAVAGPGMDQIWRGCPDYPSSGTDPRPWLRAHVVRPGAYHVGATGRSRRQIERELRLRAAIGDHIDGLQAAGTLPPAALDIHRALRAHVAADPDFAWAAQPDRAATAAERVARLRHVAGSSDRSLALPAGLGLAALVVLGRRSPSQALVTLLAGGGVAAGWLRWRERTDPHEDRRVPDELFDAVERVEDRAGVATNHLASLVDVKPGVGRRTALRAVLSVIDVAARAVYTKGELGGIPSIHFAHWSVVDGGRRLLFLSNYDGSWESYLDDFIEKAASGLTAVWSHSVDFPPCRWLGIPTDSGGARHGPAFKRVARNSQAATTIHFTAYPALSVRNILDNSALRSGLARDLDETEAQAWLSRL